MDTPTTYFFIRVPKCASTALREALVAAHPTFAALKLRSPMSYSWGQGFYGNLRLLKKERRMLWNNFRVLSYPAMWKKLAADNKIGRIISGHIRYSEIKMDLSEVRLVTLLRDPVDRFISEYNYSRNSYQNKGFLSQRLYTDERSYAGRYSLEDYVTYLETTSLSKHEYQLEYVVDLNFQGDPIEFMEKNYFCYGLVENMAAFKSDFLAKTGVELKLQNLNRSSGSSKVSISKSLRTRIETLCSKDIEFYNHIKQSISAKSDISCS